jgi:hypothetical protein
MGELRFHHPSPSVMLRGAFGTHLRLAVCPTPSLDCERCPFRHDCAYTQLFKGTFHDRARAPRIQTPPVPFILRAVDVSRSALQRNDPFDVDLLLVGAAIRHSSIALATLRRIAHEGLGPRPQRVALELESITALDAQLLPVEDAHPEHATYELDEVARRSDEYARRIRIDFESPLCIQRDKCLIEEPTIVDIAIAAHRRISELAQGYATPLAVDSYAPLLETARSITVRRSDLRTEQSWRISSRTGERQLLRGVLGSLVLDGPLAPLMPWLRAVERLQLGRKTAFGLGRLRIDVLH